MRHLHRKPDASFHDLAVETFQTDQSMGELSKQMVGRGLFTRIDGPGRAVRHSLTSAGQVAYEAGSGVVDGILAESIRTLTTAERTFLHAMLIKAASGLALATPSPQLVQINDLWPLRSDRDRLISDEPATRANEQATESALHIAGKAVTRGVHRMAIRVGEHISLFCHVTPEPMLRSERAGSSAGDHDGAWQITKLYTPSSDLPELLTLSRPPI